MSRIFGKGIFSCRKIRFKKNFSTIHKPNYWVIISAAGLGSRMNSMIPKQYLFLQNETILKKNIRNFLKLQFISKIVITVDKKDTYWDKCQILHKKVAIVYGGKTRSISISNGLYSLQDTAHERDWVLVHDAVRPFTNRFLIDNLLLLTHEKEEVGGLPAIPIHDTVKNYPDECILRTIKKEGLYLSHTPQIFRYGVIKKGLESVIKSSLETTDESNALELIGESPKITIGDRRNIKITSRTDMVYSSKLF